MSDAVDGLAAFDAAVANLNRRMQDAVPGAVHDAAALIEAEIIARAPVDTGALVKSISEKDARNNGRAESTVEVQNSSKGGAEHYAIFVEYGTSKSPAKPFFRPGVAAARAKVAALLDARFSAQIKGGN